MQSIYFSIWGEPNDMEVKTEMFTAMIAYFLHVYTEVPLTGFPYVQLSSQGDLLVFNYSATPRENFKCCKMFSFCVHYNVGLHWLKISISNTV